jgi:glycosyltransferase involved in cell wall biosynthesis
MVKVLSFGYDTSLLLPESLTNEGQYRQYMYCQILNMQKAVVVLTGLDAAKEQHLFSGKIWAVSARGKHTWEYVWSAYQVGLHMGKQFKPDMIEYQDPMPAGLPAMLVSLYLGVPLIGGVFNDLVDNPTWLGRSILNRLYNVLGKLILMRSKCIRCDSRETTDRLNQLGFTQVEYIPFFVPWLERFAVTKQVQEERLKYWHSDPVLLSVARLSSEKNIALLLKAFAIARARVNRGRLQIIGDGYLEVDLKHLAQQLQIAEHVEWMGQKDYLALPAYYQRGNIFVLSSDSETSARVLILAQASRLPTITTETSGSRAIVRDGVTGLVVPVGDETGFAEALARLLGDEQVYAKMLSSESYTALDMFGESLIHHQLRAFYERALL